MKHVQLDVDSYEYECTPKAAVTESSAINKEEYSCMCLHKGIHDPVTMVTRGGLHLHQYSHVPLAHECSRLLPQEGISRYYPL